MVLSCQHQRVEINLDPLARWPVGTSEPLEVQQNPGPTLLPVSSAGSNLFPSGRVCVPLLFHGTLLLSLILGVNIFMIKVLGQSQEPRGWDYHGNIWAAC